MVERPIKKSEREAMAQSSPVEEANEGDSSSATQSLAETSKPQPVIKKDRSKEKGRGRGGQKKDEQSGRPPVNPALIRGPKPTKPRPPVIQEAQAVTHDEDNEDTVAATDQEET